MEQENRAERPTQPAKGNGFVRAVVFTGFVVAPMATIAIAARARRKARRREEAAHVPDAAVAASNSAASLPPHATDPRDRVNYAPGLYSRL